MGCGRVGSSLAASLDRLGHSVAVIDQDPAGLPPARPPSSPATRSPAWASTGRCCVEAGIERADAFAAVSSGDNSNIISARVARETFGVDRVVARIYDAKRAEVYERLGIPTVATVPWTTDRLLRSCCRTAWRQRGATPPARSRSCRCRSHEDWVGRPLARAGGGHRRAAWRSSSASASACCPRPETFVQDDDTIYVAAVSGTVSDVTSAAAAPPPQEG